MRAAVDQRTEGISAVQPFLADPLHCPAPVVNRVERLDRGDHALLREPRDARRAEVLGMFDAETAILGAVGPRNIGEDIEHVVIGAVADRMRRDVQPVRVGSADPLAQIGQARHADAALARRVGVIVVEHRCARAERPVGQRLDSAPTKPVVAAAFFRDDLGHLFPIDQRHEGIETHVERLARMEPAQRTPAGPVDLGIVDVRDPLAQSVADTQQHRLIGIGVALGRDHALDQLGGIVLQHAGRIALRVADDHAASGVGRVAVDTGQLQRDAVEQVGMQIGTRQGDRRVGSRGVDPVVGRQSPAQPLFIPCTAQNPFARPRARRRA